MSTEVSKNAGMVSAASTCVTGWCHLNWLRKAFSGFAAVAYLHAIVIVATWMNVVATGARAEEELARLRLNDGGFSAGYIVASQHPERLGWQSEGFTEPFHIDLKALRSVMSTRVEDGAEQPDPAPKGQLFEMTRGGMLAGDLLSMDDQWLTIASPILGEVRLARSSCLTIVDAAYAGQLVYSGPVDDERWIRQGNAEDWQFEAGALVATRQGAKIVGDVNIPAKAQIHMVLSWKGSPDFVFSLGTLKTNKVSRIEEIPAAARLEVWDRDLALVRDATDSADIVMLTKLTTTRLELTVYLDQLSGTVTVCDSHGRPLNTLRVPAERPIVRSSVHLANHGPSMSIERFEVRQWDGLTTTSGGDGDRFVLDNEGQLIKGYVEAFEPKTQEFLVRGIDGKETRLSIHNFRRADVVPPPNAGSASNADKSNPAAAAKSELPPPVSSPGGLTSEQADQQDDLDPEQSDAIASTKTETTDVPSILGDEQNQSEEVIEETEIEFILSDRSRLRGFLRPSRDEKLILDAEGIDETIAFTRASVRGVIGSASRVASDLTKHKNGTIKINETQLLGYLEEDSSQGENQALRWHPHCSLNSSALVDSAKGAIVYRRPLPKPVQAQGRGEAPAPAVPRPLQIFLGGGNSVPSPTSATPTINPNHKEIMFRSGDSVIGTVERIDENGITFSSEQTTTKFATNPQVQHVWLNRNSQIVEISPKKLERLMTVPRSMKDDPPTHLLISVTGDYLRGRLVSFADGIITVEIRLELVQIPAAQIAQIVWLHDRDWTEKSQPKDGDAIEITKEQVQSPFQVHAIRVGDRGLTFRPLRLVNNALIGSSDLLGDCSVAISEVDQLLFGRDIADEIRQFQEDPWTLSLAQYPRVYADSGSAEGAAGVNSHLVGSPAPVFGLRTMDGEPFRLVDNRDRIVVLDFWASWCGPCIQTMPLVDEAITEIGADKVNLVAINIQEPLARVEAAIERLGIDATVLLDTGGQVAAAYEANAIPQTVVIDRQGNVTHLFVGGGARFVAELKQALISLLEKEP